MQNAALRSESEDPEARPYWQCLILAFLLIVLLGLRAQGLFWIWRFNLAVRLTLLGISGTPPALARANDSLALLTGENCRAFWFQGLIAHLEGRPAARHLAWEKWLQCPDVHVAFLEATVGDDLLWAERSLHLAPQDAESWFWLARIYERERPEDAIWLYRCGLMLKPIDTHRWDRLGFLLARSNPEAAFEAFVRSCSLGGKGCRWAGNIARQQGDLETAIRYYRLDPSETVHQWADELEEEMHQRDRNTP